MGDTRYFTLCWNGVPGSPKRAVWRYHHDKFTDVNTTGSSNPFALVFGTGRRAIEDFKRVSISPLAQRLFGRVVFGTYSAVRGDAYETLVLSAYPEQCEPLNSFSDNVVLVKDRKDAVHEFSMNELYKTCIHPIKFGSNCHGCPDFDACRSGKCILACLLRAAKKRGIAPHRLKPDAEKFGVTADELQKSLRAWASNGYAIDGFEYVPPTKTREQVIRVPTERVPVLRFASEHYLQPDCIARNHAEASDRAHAGVLARRLLRQCKEDCALFRHCTFHSNGRYRSRAAACRGEGRYPMSGLCGPYSESDIMDIYAGWANGIPDQLTRKELSFIAYNGSKQTRALGFTMTLLGVRADMKTVIFQHRYYNCRSSFRFQDAFELMKTGWRHGSTYKYFEPTEPPREFTDEEFFMYAEICQHRNLPGYGGFCGYVTPYITCIEWTPETHAFYVAGHCGYGHTVRNLKETIALFDFQNTIRARG